MDDIEMLEDRLEVIGQLARIVGSRGRFANDEWKSLMAVIWNVARESESVSNVAVPIKENSEIHEQIKRKFDVSHPIWGYVRLVDV